MIVSVSMRDDTIIRAKRARAEAADTTDDKQSEREERARERSTSRREETKGGREMAENFRKPAAHLRTHLCKKLRTNQIDFTKKKLDQEWWVVGSMVVSLWSINIRLGNLFLFEVLAT